MRISKILTVGFIKMCFMGLAAVSLFAVTPGCGGVAETEVLERELIAAGKASYRAYCAGCHGREGKGDGPATEYMTVLP